MPVKIEVTYWTKHLSCFRKPFIQDTKIILTMAKREAAGVLHGGHLGWERQLVKPSYLVNFAP